MLAVKREVGIARVIEARVVPVGRVVAGLALLTAAPFVRIVRRVAGVSGFTGRGRKGMVRVTAETLRIPVPAHEREFRRVVIELCVMPRRRHVACAAFGSQHRIVSVVVAVAVDTCLWSIPVFYARGVTGAALVLEVFAFKRKVGETMVETSFVEDDNAGIAPFVIRVAICALSALHVCVPAVITEIAGNVCGDGLVTVKAELPLCRFVEHLVTRRALGFDIGMSGDNLAGHHERLYILCVQRRCGQ